MPEKNRNRGGIMKRREWASLIILALAAVPALLVAIGQVYVTGVDGIRLRRPETIELLAEIIVLFFLDLFAIWKIDRNRLRAGAALLITAGFLWIHQAFTAMFLSGAYVLVLLMLGARLRRGMDRNHVWREYHVITGLAGTAAGVAGAVASTSTASAIGGSAAGAATGTATGTGTAVAGAKAAGVAGKAGIKGLFQTLKAKVIAGVTAAALVAGGVTAGILTHNKKPDTGNHYRPVEITVCDDDYITLTIKRVYEQGYVPSEEEMPMYQLDPETWTGEDCLLRNR